MSITTATTPTPEPHPTPDSHLAKAEEAERQAISLSVRCSVRSFASAFSADVPEGDLEQLRAARDSYSQLAAAHRLAARRMERLQRIRRWLGVA